MFTATLAQLILEVLDEEMKNLVVFTAYDITISARAKTSDNVKHNDVRNMIENEFVTQEMTGYDRELCTLNLGDSPQANVYFPDSKSASDHDLVDSGSVSDPIDTDTDDDGLDGGDDGTTTTAPVALADDEFKTTKEGRVQIPRTVLKQVNTNGGTYDVMISGSLKCGKPDARGDVRISLRQFGINSAKVRLTVDTATDTINLEAI